MWWCTISKWLCNWYQYAPIWVPSFLNALVKWGRPAPKHLLNNMWESSMALQDPILYCGWRPPTQNWDLQFLDFDQFISMILNGTWGAHLRVCRVFFLMEHDFIFDFTKTKMQEYEFKNEKLNLLKLLQYRYFCCNFWWDKIEICNF